MFKKIFLILIFCFFLLIVILGAFYKQKKNEFIFWTIQLKPVAEEFIERNIEEFKEKHNDVDIVWIDIPIAEAQKRILASILGGNPPDLVNLNPDFSVILAQIGALEYFSGDELKDFDNNVVNALKYDSQIYGVPFYGTSSVTVLNKKCTDDFSNLKRYDDILKISNKCQNAFAININENDTLAKILNKYDVYTFKKDIDYKRAEYVFKMFNDMYKKEIIPKDSLTINHREVVEKYMAGDTMAVVVGGNFVKMIEENAKDVYKNSAILPQLTGSSGKYDISLMNFVIPKKAKNKDLAREFLFQLTSAPNQIEFAKLTNVLVSNKEALKDDFFKCKSNSNLKDRARCIGVNQMKNLMDKNFGYLNKKEINDSLNLSLEEYILDNKFDIKKIGVDINILQKGD